MQETLFGEKTLPEKAPVVSQPQEKKSKLPDCAVSSYSNNEKYTDEYCFKQITSDTCLWDMRCWDEYHNKDEVMCFLSQIEESLNGGTEPAYNCGHVVFCIKLLLKRGVDKGNIASAMLSNNNIMYSRRLLKCFAYAGECPKLIANGGHFGNDICHDCENPPKAEKKKKEALSWEI